MPVSHAFVSGVTDEIPAGRVRPSNWNAGHVVSVDLASEVTGVLHETHGGTNQSSYTVGDTLAASGTNTLAIVPGNIDKTRKFYMEEGDGANAVLPIWDTILAADIPRSALTKADDTNVTLTLGGAPATALLAATSLTLGWTGTLAVAGGGTGSGTAGGARTNLGVAIGTNVQAWSASLDNIVALAGAGMFAQTSTGNYSVRTITGTANRITMTNGNGVSGNPTIDISSAYVGQNTITTLGTITTGVWTGTSIALANGGTNAALTADNGAIPYSTSSAIALLASTATANKLLVSGASAAPSWSIPTFPNASATSGKIITSDGTNWIASTTIWPNALTTGSVLFGTATNTIGQNNNAFQYDNTNSRLILNVNAAAPPAAIANSVMLHLVGKDATNSSIEFDAYGGIATYRNRVTGGTLAAKTAIPNGQILVSLAGAGYETNTPGYTNNVVSVTMVANENFTNAAQGTYVAFSATPNGSTTIAEVVRFLGAGNVQFVNAAKIGRAHV